MTIHTPKGTSTGMHITNPHSMRYVGIVTMSTGALLSAGCSSTTGAMTGAAIGSLGGPAGAVVGAGIGERIGDSSEQDRARETRLRRVFDSYPHAELQKLAREWKSVIYLTRDSKISIIPVQRTGNSVTFQVVSLHSSSSKPSFFVVDMNGSKR